MITIDEARELVNNAVIPFPTDWKQLFLADVETSIKNQANRGKRLVSINGKITANVGGGGWGDFYLNADQLMEIIGVLKSNGFHVESDLRVRYDGRTLTLDIFW